MEKKKYQIPALTVVALQQQAALMQNSNPGESGSDDPYTNPEEYQWKVG